MLKNKSINIVKFIIFIVLFCTYIFPLGIIDSTYVLSKLIFIISVVFYYIFNIKSLNIREILFIVILSLMSIILKDITYLVFISIPLLEKIIQKKEIIKEYLLSSNILYICLFFTFIYSIIYFGDSGRFAFTAIKEFNQSGLAIFCLGLLLLRKNKKIGIFTLIFGMLTFSRSYILSIILLLFSKTKMYNIFVTEKIIKRTSYLTLTIISSIIFVILGFFYVNQYKLGNVYYSANLRYKFINLLDYSNLFRFAAILKICRIYIKYPIKLFSGITDFEYLKYGNVESNFLGIPGSRIVPHNLFFSHLKKYGIISIIETWYVSIILKKLVNKNNYHIYISIVLYSLILGAGLYSYWLYLSIFVIILFEKKDFTKDVA